MTGRLGTEEALEHASEPSAAPSTLRRNAMSRRRPAPDGTGTMGGDRVPEVLTQLEALADPTRLAGMARYGISTTHALGVSMPRRRGRGRPLRPVRRSPDGRQSSAGTLTTSRSLSGTRTGSIVGSWPSTWIWGSHWSHDGRYQFTSPSRRIAA